MAKNKLPLRSASTDSTNGGGRRAAVGDSVGLACIGSRLRPALLAGVQPGASDADQAVGGLDLHGEESRCPAR